MVRRSCWILLAVAAAACEPRPETPSGAAVFDSAGVRVIELGDGGWEGGVRRFLASEPDLVIRSAEEDGAPVLFEVRDVQPISGDRIAVANGGTNEILVFDGAGSHLATWGGVGEGPGEFQDLQWLTATSPDTLAAGDYRQRRVSILDANGRFVTSIGTPNLSADASPSIPPQPITRLRDGTLIAESFRGPAGEEGSVRPATELFVVDPGADAPRAFATFPGNEITLVREGEFLAVVRPPFARNLHVEPAANGIWVGDDARWELREYSSGGRLRTLIRSAESPEAVTDQLLEQHIDDKYEDIDPDIDPQPLKRLQRSIADHATVPSFGAIRAIPGDGVAVGRYDTGASLTRIWRTVDRNGAVESIRIPTSFDVKRWGSDWILVVLRDELDREEIRRYRILERDHTTPRQATLP